MRETWFSRGMGLVLLGSFALFVAVGCRSSGTSQADSVDEPTVSLGNAQVADVQVALGRTMEARGQSRQAIPIYAEAVKNDPRRADGWVRLAVNSDKEGMFAESAEYYQKALTLDPANPDTYCNLGYSLYLQQRLPESEAALRRAIELKPDHQRAQNNLGMVLARSGRGSEALEAFRRAGCTQADAHTNLAYGLTLNGSLPDAREQYERALAADSTSPAARKGLGELAAVVPKFVEPVPGTVAPAKTVDPMPTKNAASRTFEPSPARTVPPQAAQPEPQEVVPASYSAPAPPKHGTGILIPTQPVAEESTRKRSDISHAPSAQPTPRTEPVVILSPPQLVDMARVIPYVSALKYLSTQAGCVSKLDPPSF